MIDADFEDKEVRDYQRRFCRSQPATNASNHGRHANGTYCRRGRPNLTQCKEIQAASNRRTPPSHPSPARPFWADLVRGNLQGSQNDNIEMYTNDDDLFTDSLNPNDLPPPEVMRGCIYHRGI